MHDREKTVTDEFGRKRVGLTITGLFKRVWWAWWLPWVVGPAIIVAVLFADDTLRERTASAAGRLPDDGKLYVRIFDVGQGDAILIRTPSGDDILVDGGPDDRVVEKLSRALPSDDRDIELIIVTHPHADHIAGLVEVLKRYDVRRVWTPGTDNDTASFRAFEEAVDSENAEVLVAAAGQAIDFGSVRLLVLHPFPNTPPEDDVNDQSIVFLLTHGTDRLLFTGDSTEKVETQLVARASSTLRAAFLKIAHHGSRYSTSRKFLEAVRPTIAAVSVGARNTYGHPSYRTLRRLTEAGIKVHRTDEQGDLTFTTDGISGILPAN